jgi:hypothetical protein
MAALSQLLSGTFLDPTGAVMPFTGEELRDRFETLGGERPNAFRESESHEQAVWHEQMSDEATRVRQWSSVIWHIDRALCLDPSIDQLPTFDEVISRRGEAHAELGHWAEAKADFERGAQLSPDKFFHRYCLMYALLALGETNEYRAASTAAVNDFKWALDARKRTIHRPA